MNLEPMGVANLLAGIISALAALGALYFASRSPSKKDLERVEGHVAKSATEIGAMRNHLDAQARREAMDALGRSISLSISGVQDAELVEPPLVLEIVQCGSAFFPMEIELLTVQQICLRSLPCQPGENEENSCVNVPETDLYKWLNASGYIGGTNMRQMLLRIHGRLEGGETSRLVTLQASQIAKKSEARRCHTNVLSVEGSI